MALDSVPPFETKAEPAGGSDPALRRLFEDHLTAFEDFKTVNEVRLQELSTKGASDALTYDKLARIEARLDALSGQMRSVRRPQLGPGVELEPDERKAALESYIRKGKTDAFDVIETKGMSVGSEADGGYLVHDEMDSRLHSALKEESPLRRLASGLTMSSAVYKRPFAISGPGSGWVAETAARPETATPQIAELTFPAMELYAMPVATKQVLDDGIIDIEAWLTQELSDAFAEQETIAFLYGDGLASPRGLLDYPQQPADSATFGQVGTVLTGAAGTFGPNDSADSLIDLVHALPAKYRRNGHFLMNRLTLSAVRRLKSGSGDYLLQTQLTEGFKMSVLGFPVTECDDMPGMAGGDTAIAFADFKRAYLVVDRQGVQILRDPYSAKPYVLFYATKRVGGGIADFNAIRLLKFSTA
ncbi:MAG: phage major capsid protein [Roseibium sp.]|nr:phage major capsid protein [Roseibium sp.]